MHPADSSHPPFLRHWKAYLFLFVLAIVAYWPISLQLFSVKNDAIHYFLPVRYQISNSIQHGYFPYWANSFYLGYPLHGDMQTGVWNPFVQLISVFTTYNVSVFHLEMLFYIFLAGAGMYKLSSAITPSTFCRLITASAYMLSGYILGSGEFINWLASAAFIPFLLFYYHKLLHDPGASNAIKTALAAWLLFVCGYPADSIIIAYVLTGMCIFYLSSERKTIRKDPALLRKHLVSHGMLVITTLLLSLPALISSFELLPYYSRGAGTGITDAMINSFDPRSSISFVAPGAVVANDFTTQGDITGRNIYMGLYTFVFALSSLFLPNNSRKIILFIAATASFLFCLGDATPFRGICYDLLPGMNTFRHPSHFRLYTILSILLLGTISLDFFMQSEKKFVATTRIIFFTLAGALLLVVIACFLSGSSGKAQGLLSAISSREQLKVFLQELTWKDLLLVCSMIQFLFTCLFIFLIRGQRIIPKKTILILHISNLVVMSTLVLPATFVSKTSPSVINGLIHEKAAFDDPSAYNRTLQENAVNALEYSNDIGISFFYSQQPGLTKITNSPAFLASMDSFAQTSRLYDYVGQKPVAWLSNKTLTLTDTAKLSATDTAQCVYSFANVSVSTTGDCDLVPGTASVVGVAPGRFVIKANASDTSVLNLSQAWHHRWRATHNGEAITISKSNIAFMSVPVAKGESEIIWQYNPGMIRYAFLLSLLTLLVSILVLVIKYRKAGTNFVSTGRLK